MPLTQNARRGWSAAPTMLLSGLNSSAAITAVISRRYSAKKYSSRFGMDSMRSINEALGDTPELPFWLPW